MRLLDETRRYRTSGFLRLLNCIQRDARANVCPDPPRKMLMALPPGSIRRVILGDAFQTQFYCLV